MQRYQTALLIAILFPLFSCRVSRNNQAQENREWYVSDVNRKIKSNEGAPMRLSLEGNPQTTLVITCKAMDIDLVNSILSSETLVKQYKKYGFPLLKFTNGTPNTFWIAKLENDKYNIIIFPD